MSFSITRRNTFAALTALVAVAGTTLPAAADDRMTLRMATSGSETDQRSVAMAQVFAPIVSGFADYQPGYNGTLFAQGTELEAMARGNLEMAIVSAQELAQFMPEFSIFATGYVHQNAAHQVSVFSNDLMDPFHALVEETLNVKLLSVMYLGRRHVNLRQSREELDVRTPADLKGVNLRMPGTDAWQFLGKALGASPTPLAFSEVYTALSTGAIDGQDNPLPTVVDKKFYEVTKQIALTSHLVDLNYIAISLEAWNAMSEDQQETVQVAADAAAALGRERQLGLEASLAAFLEEQGVEVYTPDLAAFRSHVQGQYAGSDLAKSWPEGTLDAINALGE